ncbi:MAG: hypothetical protein MUC50_00885 [Myxococcota bacterium]|nr:hypothetical protein [Myxococcota bacterium]
MAKPSVELLNKYNDRELSPSEWRRVDAQVASSVESKGELEKMRRIGELVRLMGDELSSAVSFEGFSERVAAGVRADRPLTLGEKLSVFTREFFEHRRQVWIPAACAAAAVLAVVLALPFFGAGAGATAPVWTASASGGAQEGSLIQEVSFGDLRGAVYQVEDGRGGTAGVVWIVE